jgi:hypothetical protein
VEIWSMPTRSPWAEHSTDDARLWARRSDVEKSWIANGIVSESFFLIYRISG